MSTVDMFDLQASWIRSLIKQHKKMTALLATQLTFIVFRLEPTRVCK